MLVKFADMCGATVCKFWKPNVTHVVATTDVKGACTRTMKVLMAILSGKWILTMDCKHCFLLYKIVCGTGFSFGSPWNEGERSIAIESRNAISRMCGDIRISCFGVEGRAGNT